MIIGYTELLLKPPQSDQISKTSQGERLSSQTNSPSSSTDTGSKRAGPVVASQSVKTDSSLQRAETSGEENTSLPSEIPTQTEITNSPTLSFSTSKYKAEILLLGGQLKSFGLTEHTKELGGEESFNLVHVQEDTPLPFGVSLLGGSDRKILFSNPTITPAEKLQGDTVSLNDGEEVQLTLQAPLEFGGTYTKTYRFVGGTYFVDVTAELSDPPQSATPNGDFLVRLCPGRSRAELLRSR